MHVACLVVFPPIIDRQVEVLRDSVAWSHETVPGIAMILDDEAVLETNGDGRLLPNFPPIPASFACSQQAAIDNVTAPAASPALPGAHPSSPAPS